MLENNNYQTLIPLLVIVVVFALPAAAAGGSVTEVGNRALETNPGAVNADDSFVNFNISGNASLWNNLFVNDFIDEDMKDSYLQSIENTGFIVGNNFSGGLSLGIGPITGFSRLRNDSIIKFPYKAGELVLRGNQGWEEDEVYFSLDGTEGNLGVYGDLGFNVGYQLPSDYVKNVFGQSEYTPERLFVGANYHYMTGIIGDIRAGGNVEIEYDEDGFVELADTDDEPWFEIEYTDPSEDEGELASGHVFDLGVYAEIDDQFSAGISYLGLGSLSATGVMYEKYYLDEDGETEDEPDEAEFYPDRKMEWSVPSELRMGVRYTEDWYQAHVDFTRRSYMSGTADNRFTLGGKVDYISWLPVSMKGTYSTLRNDITLDAGLGLEPGPVRIGAEVSDLMGIFNRGRSVAMDLNIGLSF